MPSIEQEEKGGGGTSSLFPNILDNLELTGFSKLGMEYGSLKFAH